MAEVGMCGEDAELSQMVESYDVKSENAHEVILLKMAEA